MSRDLSALSPRQPSPEAAAVEAFVSGVQTSIETSAPDVCRTSAGSKAVVRRRGGRLRRRRTIYLPIDVNAELERFCDENGREISNTVAEAISLLITRRA